MNVAPGESDSSERSSLTKLTRATIEALWVHSEAPWEVAVNVPPMEAFVPDTRICLLVVDWLSHTSCQNDTRATCMSYTHLRKDGAVRAVQRELFEERGCCQVVQSLREVRKVRPQPAQLGKRASGCREAQMDMCT